MMGLSSGPSSFSKNQEVAATTRQAASAKNDRKSAAGRPRSLRVAFGRGSTGEGVMVSARMLWVSFEMAWIPPKTAFGR